MLFPWQKLNKVGVIGINRRNSEFVLPNNKREFYPLVDDKIQTKNLAIKNKIAVPELYAVIEAEHQVKNFEKLLKSRDDFVIKPAHGSGGEGILVIKGKFNAWFRQVNGLLINQVDLKHHLSNILSGIYSLGGQNDVALIEYRVIFDPVFETICYQGVPDVRVIVYKGYPAMAMVRLPTRNSGGKANLHQGAIGVGIDMQTGKTLDGVLLNEFIDFHPDTGYSLSGVTIPEWEKVLTLASSCYELTQLGYLGVDIVLDKELGPLMLEMNARPGLNIQIANNKGLLNTYKQIEKICKKDHSVDKRVELSINELQAA